jgi:CRP-like cAMP-binding protein
VDYEKVDADSKDAWRFLVRVHTDTHLLSTFAHAPAQVIAAMQRVIVMAGDTIIEEGEAGEYFYTVTSGELDVFTAKAGGTAVFRYTVGCSFGELALVIPRSIEHRTYQLQDMILVLQCRYSITDVQQPTRSDD